MYLYIRTMPMANLWQDDKWCTNIAQSQVCVCVSTNIAQSQVRVCRAG